MRNALGKLGKGILTIIVVIASLAFTLYLISNVFRDVKFVKNIFSSEKIVEPVVASESTPTPVVEEKPVEDPLNAQTILELVNEERAKVGAKPLEMDERLNQSAQAKCEDMQTNDYFSHEDKQGNSPFMLISKYFPDYDKLGENLIYGAGESSEKFLSRWMNSPEHKKNIVDGDFSLTGVSVCTIDPNWTRYTDGHYAVQHFGK